MSLLGLLWRYLAVMAVSCGAVLALRQVSWWHLFCWAIDICANCEQTYPWHMPTCTNRKASGWQDRAELPLRGPC